MQWLHFDRLVLEGLATPVTLIARPVDERTLAGFLAEPPGLPKPSGEIPVWVSEAARELHGWKPGARIELRDRVSQLSSRLTDV